MSKITVTALMVVEEEDVDVDLFMQEANMRVTVQGKTNVVPKRTLKEVEYCSMQSERC